MNNILISNNITDKIRQSLIDNNFNVILLPDYNKLVSPVMSHADMLLYKISDNNLLTYSEYYDLHGDIFSSIDCSFTKCVIEPGKEYPDDIALNALKIKNMIFGREECLANEIRAGGSKIIDVKQGYARCSCLCVDDEFVITADASMAVAFKNNGIDVIKIQPGNIAIEKYEYGFIGGASFVFNETVYFFGDINKHPDGKTIVRSINDRNKKVCCLSDDPLYDYGGAVII